MAKAKTTKAIRVMPQMMHENDLKTGLHRIVVVTEGGAAERSAWFTFQQIAELGNIRAATSFYSGCLPEGVFQVRSMPHVSL